MRYAAIDIGTVTCRLLVADVDSCGLRPLVRLSNIANLGAGVDATGQLAADSIECTCAVLKDYIQIIEKYSVDMPVKVRCLATSASRDACNANVFAQRLADLGIELLVIPGTYEAQLSFLGASADFAGEALLVSDIGGGSTELIVGVAGDGIVHSHSFNIGCRRATERLLHSDPPTQQELDELAAWVAPEFASFFAQVKEKGFVPQRYIAVAGTSTSVVSVDQAMDPYDASRVHKTDVSGETLNRVLDKLASLPLQQRQQVVGLQPSRAPIIVAGLVILQQVLAASGLDGFTASETDILEGIILDAAAHDGVLA